MPTRGRTHWAAQRVAGVGPLTVQPPPALARIIGAVARRTHWDRSFVNNAGYVSCGQDKVRGQERGHDDEAAGQERD